MAQPLAVEPDLRFIKEVKACGGDALKKCFQCATCSTVCNLSPDDRPFPRKEMIWAQWGLKGKLATDADLWLCHQCNDCTRYCPRGAKPGDVMAALRRLTILENGFPRFVARMVNDPRLLPVVFAIPVILLLLLMVNAGTLQFPDGEIIYRKFIPQWPVVDVLFPLTAIWTLVCSAVIVRRFWSGLRAGSDDPLSGKPLSWKDLSPSVSTILRHSYFRECKAAWSRYLAHFGVMWGFILLAVTTTCVAAGVYLFRQETPYSFSNPIKWIGNIGALVLILGSSQAVINRFYRPDDMGKGTYFDWLFLLVVLAAGVTGLLTEVLRVADIPHIAYPVYFVHLVVVWFLFAYLPFSKFCHALYQTTALVYARHTGRELKKGSTIPSPALIEASSPPENH